MRLLYSIITIFFFLMSLDAKYYSQCNQDKWLNETIFQNKPNGVFFEIGAYDGIKFSNSYFFEKECNWTGICIEPMHEYFIELQKNRNCICIEGGIGEKNDIKKFLRVYSESDMLSGFVDKYDPRHIQRIFKELKQYGGHFEMQNVPTFTINELLEKNNIYFIDLLSVDIEGGELDILKSIDFNKFYIDVILVENNYCDKNFEIFLSSKGYKKLINLGGDEVYKKLK